MKTRCLKFGTTYFHVKKGRLRLRHLSKFKFVWPKIQNLSKKLNLRSIFVAANRMKGILGKRIILIEEVIKS